jgi:hypothetical protein
MNEEKESGEKKEKPKPQIEMIGGILSPVICRRKKTFFSVFWNWLNGGLSGGSRGADG